tara:strand:+ start:569 stop:751 length:183 start_codon:yes stop_codon:yes gene_type:complete
MNLFRVNSFIFFFTLLQCLLGCIEKKFILVVLKKNFVLVVLKKIFALVVFKKNLNFPLKI